ncbi:S8 family peptidase [Effusibacillus consociatus]|uniref:S8 family peptidase n=1 Tax=Effusibacillus consociatus TaxID=1117041 RepID=A0ABV9QCF0_9BACL
MLKHSGKMDTHLKRALVHSYRPLRKTPCFLQRFTRWLLDRTKKLSVIIQFDDQVTTATAAALNEHAKSHRLKVTRHHPMIQSVTAKVSISRLKCLCDSEAVKGIYLDREVHAVLDSATPSIGSSAAQQSGLTGKGVTIGVIDTGIYPHPDLTQPRNRIIAFKDFVNNRTEPYDDNGHGTHVAGDAAGNGLKSQGKYRGSAPEADLVGVKVLNKQGSGQLSSVIAGIEWCVVNCHLFGIRIISLSLGSTATTASKDDPVCQAVEKAWKAGLVVVVAAGNEGPASGTIASPGISPSVITVGAADDHNTVSQSDDTAANFSSRGPTIEGLTKPDILAPGVAITSLRSPRSFLDKSNSGARVGDWYFTLSGTSMATPIVSGAIAQILEQKPNLTPDQVKALLKEHAVDLGLDPNTQGSGEVNVNFLQ